MKQYFQPDFLDFFKELAANNHKDWFDENRKRYQTTVKEPFERFVTDLIGEVAKKDKTIDITYKEAIFRINRDIRFSKNKDPYKLNRSAIISPNGRKDKAFPGLYFEAGPEAYRIYGGVYQPDKDQLYSIREQIAANPTKFNKLIAKADFVEAFGQINGDKNKIIPKEFKEAAEKAPLLFNKQFYWYVELDPEFILKDNLIEETMHYYTINKPVMDFFSSVLKRA